MRLSCLSRISLNPAHFFISLHCLHWRLYLLFNYLQGAPYSADNIFFHQRFRRTFFLPTSYLSLNKYFLISLFFSFSYNFFALFFSVHHIFKVYLRRYFWQVCGRSPLENWHHCCTSRQTGCLPQVEHWARVSKTIIAAFDAFTGSVLGVCRNRSQGFDQINVRVVPIDMGYSRIRAPIKSTVFPWLKFWNTRRPIIHMTSISRTLSW